MPIPAGFARKHASLLATLLLPLVAFGLAAWSSTSIFDRLPRTEDEVTFLFQAKTIAEGHLIAPGPEHGEFFFMSFVIVRDGQWFGKYPPGYPALLSVGTLLGRPWLVNAAASAVAVGLLLVVGRRFYDLRTALLAGALMVLSPFFILQSGSLLSHVVALCWVMLLLLLIDIMRRRDLPLVAAGAGVAGGMLLLTRPLTAVGIALPFVAVAAIDLTSRRPLLGRYAFVALGSLPLLAALLLYNDATTGSPFRSAYELWWPYDRVGFGEEYGVNGHTPHDALRNMRSNLRDLSVVLFGWPRRLSFLPVVVAIGYAAWRMRRREISRETSADLLLAGMVVGLIVVHLFYWTPGKMYGPRYYFEIIGALSLLGARGIVLTWDEVGRMLRRLHPSIQPLRVVVPAIVVGLFGFNLLATLPDEAERYRDWNGVHRHDLETIREAELENALVFVPRPNWQAYAPLFLENSTTLNGEVIYAVDRGDDRISTLMRDFPDRNYYRYRDGALIPLDGPDAGIMPSARRW